MALLVPKKRSGGPHPPAELQKLHAPGITAEDGDDEMDFGDDYDGEDDNYGDDVGPSDDLPSYEQDPFAAPASSSAGQPASSPTLMKKSFKKLMHRSDSVGDAATTVSKGAAPDGGGTCGKADKSQLSCQLSRDLHRRLKIYSIVNGKSILSVLEGWIEEHCPPL